MTRLLPRKVWAPALQGYVKRTEEAAGDLLDINLLDDYPELRAKFDSQMTALYSLDMATEDELRVRADRLIGLLTIALLRSWGFADDELVLDPESGSVVGISIHERVPEHLKPLIGRWVVVDLDAIPPDGSSPITFTELEKYAAMTADERRAWLNSRSH